MNGIKSMEKEDADMTSGLWKECENCKDNNWEEE